MIPILVAILTGMITGYLTRSRPFHRYTNTLLTVVIGLLLFFLGMNVGSNQEITRNFPRIGWEAFLLTMGGTAGSLVLARYVYVHFFKK